jgi:glycosyltransferase A (GT-A) superfamily protein (DUF2064 family)
LAHPSTGEGDAAQPPNGATHHRPGDFQAIRPPAGDHRARLARALGEAVAEALAAGDARAASVAVDALAQLTGEIAKQGADAQVVDLAAERRRRGEP